MNRGNSGGPTFNTQGEVVGVNTAIYSPSGGSVGIGFAIPAETAQTIIAALKDKGSVARGWIGVQIQPVTHDIADSLGLKSNKGALVAEAQDNSPATVRRHQVRRRHPRRQWRAQSTARANSRARSRSLAPASRPISSIWHDGAEKTVSVKLGTLPDDKEAKAKPAALRGQFRARRPSA